MIDKRKLKEHFNKFYADRIKKDCSSTDCIYCIFSFCNLNHIVNGDNCNIRIKKISKELKIHKEFLYLRDIGGPYSIYKIILEHLNNNKNKLDLE